MTDRIQEGRLNDLWDEDPTRATPVPVHECIPHDQSEASHLRTTGDPHPARLEARSDFKTGLPGGYTGSKDSMFQKLHSTQHRGGHAWPWLCRGLCSSVTGPHSAPAATPRLRSHWQAMLSREAQTDKNPGRDDTGHHSRGAPPAATVPSRETSAQVCSGEKHDPARRKHLCEARYSHRGQSLQMQKP